MQEKNVFIYGKNAVIESLAAGAEIEKIYILFGTNDAFIKKINALAKKSGVPVVVYDKSKFKFLENSLEDNSAKTQGIIAQKSIISYSSIEEIVSNAYQNEKQPIIVALDGITDPHNLGAIARTALCAGAKGIILPEKNSAPINAVAVKASAGALEHIAVAKVTNLTSAFSFLKEQGFWIIGTDLDTKHTIYHEKFDAPVVLVIGSEGSGMRPGVKKQCDILVKKPMKSSLGSLNASVSSGIVLFEILRKRGGY